LLIPSLITVVGLFCGFLAILSAHQGRYQYSCIAILFAFLLDGVDGRVARHLNATSAFGREFDSLSDLVAFGVAPAVLTYCWAFAASADEFGVLVAFLFVACGAARLARFNITVSFDPRRHFEGLPIPAAALAVAALVHFHPQAIQDEFLVGAILAYLSVLSGLMVSTIPFFSIKHIKLNQRNARLILFCAALGVASAWYGSRLVLLLGSLAYTLSGVVSYAMNARELRKLKGISSG
jgi:CDP-diacylglycerol--serine O-phosphatidyltransferase